MRRGRDAEICGGEVAMGVDQLEPARGEQALQAYGVIQSVSGQVQVRWDQGNAATPMGQLAYFILKNLDVHRTPTTHT